MMSQDREGGLLATSPEFRDPTSLFLEGPDGVAPVGRRHSAAMQPSDKAQPHRRNSIITLVDTAAPSSYGSNAPRLHGKSPSVDDMCVDSSRNGSPALSTSRFHQDRDDGLTSSTSSRRCVPRHSSDDSGRQASVGPAPCWTPLCIASCSSSGTHVQVPDVYDWLHRCAEVEYRLVVAQETSAWHSLTFSWQAAINTGAHRQSVQRIATQLHTVVGHVAHLQRIESERAQLQQLELQEATQRHTIATNAMMAALADVLRTAVAAPRSTVHTQSPRPSPDAGETSNPMAIVGGDQTAGGTPVEADGVGASLPFRRTDSAIKRTSGPLQKMATEMAMELARAKAAFEAKLRTEHAEEMRALRAETDVKLEVRRRGEVTLREEIVRLKCALANAYGTVEPPNMSLEDMKELPSFRYKVREEVQRILASSTASGSVPCTPFANSVAACPTFASDQSVGAAESGCDSTTIVPILTEFKNPPPTQQTSIGAPVAFGTLEEWPMVSCVSSMDDDDDA